MAITHLLGPNPKWIIINNEGTTAGGAKMYTRRSKNKTQDKAVFQDAGGTIPWTNPIVFDLNGTQGPFYWTVDSSDLTETYYIFVNDANGDLIWDMDNYAPPGSGGGGDTTTYIPVVNYITNNQFIDHIDDDAGPIGLNLVIAPSNHKGFTPALINPVVGINGTVGPDIRFVKDSLANTDTITFPPFIFGLDPLIGDVTPVDYVRYRCTTSNPGESLKAFQFPITQKVKNLANFQVSFNIWAMAASPTDMDIYVRQYFGSTPTASADFRDKVGTLSLTATWTQLPISFTVPSVALKSLGTPGTETDDDALYLQLEMPHNELCDISFTKPALYVGADINPNIDFQTYDQINSVNSTPRTGDIKSSYVSNPLSTAANLALKGWVPMNDGSIGNVGSGATTRANKDTFQLFKTIWDGVTNFWAPTQDSGGTPVSRGASAVADFVALRRLVLPLSLGRALAAAGTGTGLTARTLGQNLGSETITLNAMPGHTHNGSGGTSFVMSTGGGLQFGAAGAPATTAAITGTVTGQSGGGSAADGNMPPTSFFNVYIKL